MEHFLLDLSEYDIVMKLVKSANKMVKGAYIVQQKANKKNYFAKVYKTKDEDKKRIFANLSNYLRARHQEILEISGFSFFDFNGEFNITILTPYMANGSLREMLDKEHQKIQTNKWTETKREICLLGIASGLLYLHSIGITHQNLKPENILFDDFFYPKINDFGYSRIFEETEEVSAITAEETKSNQEESIIEKRKKLQKNDVKDFGFILKEFFNFNDSKQSSESFPNTPNETINKMIVDCLSPKIDDVPSLEAIIRNIIDYKDHRSQEVNENEIEIYLSLYKARLAYRDKDCINTSIFYKQAIELGNSDAMNEYAKMLRDGKLIKRNPEEAVKYFKQAIVLGNSDAMNEYAKMLRDGKLIERNPEEAVKYYKQAIELGSTDAMNNYAAMLIDYKWIKRNPKEAVKYIKQAIEFGSIRAMNMYASMLNEGKLTPRNPEEAVKYYKQALELGDVQAGLGYSNILKKRGDETSIKRSNSLVLYILPTEILGQIL